LTIHIADFAATFEALFTSRDKPRELLAQATQGFLGDGTLWPADQSSGVHSAALCDGAGVLDSTQGWGLFNPARSRAASDWEFARHRALNIADGLRAVLEAAASRLPATDQLLRCTLLPCDTSTRPLMANGHGLSLFAGQPGALYVRCWPSDGNLARLPAALARGLYINRRQVALEGRALHTLRDWLATEGLAAHFVGETAAWRAPFLKAADWDDELARIATEFHGKTTFDDVLMNIYGNAGTIGPTRAPQPPDFDSDELDYMRAVTRAALDTTIHPQIAVYMYGDALVAPQGHPAEGISPFGGFALGYALVGEFLARAGLSAAEALDQPATVVIP
jgi:uncharacterized protein YjaZ